MLDSPPSKEEWGQKTFEDIRQLQMTNENLKFGIEQIQAEKEKYAALKSKLEIVE